MATSTLIQRLDSTALVTSTTVPGGYQTVTTPDVSNRRQVETFIAGATVVVGDWLQFDTSKTGAEKVLTVIQAVNTVATGNPLVVGVCLGSAEANGALTAGSKINVIVSGYAAVAAVDDGSVTAVGQPLVLDNTAGSAAGRAELQKAGALAPACGVTLSIPASNKAEVWIYKQF
jgi:hypothetical protein